MMDPIELASVPRITRSGPITARIPPITRMAFCVPGLSWFHFSDRSCSHPDSFSRAGLRYWNMVSAISYPVSLRLFSDVLNLSAGSSVSLNVLSRDPSASVTDDVRDWKSSAPLLAAVAIAGPALAPKISLAAFMASVSLLAPTMDVWISSMTSGSAFPCLAPLTIALLRPLRALLLSIPETSSCPRKVAAWLAVSPMACSCGALVTSDWASVSMLIPVSCPTLLSRSSMPPASDAGTPKASMAFWTWSMELETSVSFSWANFINFPDSFSSSSPVTPNRVLTSPTAAPAVAKSVGICWVRFLTDCCIPSRALPEAPVFWVTMSRPSSTSCHALADAPAAPTIGAVTYLDIPVPMFFILSPTSLICLPKACSLMLFSFLASVSKCFS